MKALNTISDFLHWIAAYFEEADLYYGHGTDNPWDEAVSVMMSVLGKDDIKESELNNIVPKKEGEQILALAKRRVTERLPLPYLTHTAYFAGLPFYVDARVLIPRSPIAELIEQQFSPWLSNTETPKILDMCTGSGCIAIACAHYLPQAKMDAVDLSNDALSVAQQNAQAHDCLDRVNFIASDLFSAVPEAQYDLIVSNPPYVSANSLASLPDEYQHEPAMALHAENAGLALVQRILKEAAHYLSPEGVLIVEVGESAEALEAAFPDIPFLWLDFARGGDGVFMFTRKELEKNFQIPLQASPIRSYNPAYP